MKKSFFILSIALLAACSAGITSCKDKTSESTPETGKQLPPDQALEPAQAGPAPSAVPVGAPVGTPGEEAMLLAIAAVTKDFPTVMAEVQDGEIILKGQLEKSREKDLLKALNDLKPKKITNELVIK